MGARNSTWSYAGIFALGAIAGLGWAEQAGRWAYAAAGMADLASNERAYQDLSRSDSALIEINRTLSKVAELTTPSVVHIQSRREAGSRNAVEETGSGVVIGSPKFSGVYVATNRHVIDGAKASDISIQLHDGREIHPTQIWSDVATDVAILKIPVTDVAPAKWGDSNQVQIGHLVMAVGSPFGLSQSVTLGIISAKGRRSLQLSKDRNTDLLNQDFLQTDAAINPGNSGGPLIDLQGRVIAINTAIASSGGGNEGIGFSIPSNLVRTVMEQLLEHGKVQRGYLGVQLEPQFTLRAAERLGLDKVTGALVTVVNPMTAAAKGSIEVGDVILAFDNVPVQDENHLIHLVSLTPIGRPVQIDVWRDRRKMSLSVTLSNREEYNPAESEPAMAPRGSRR